MRKLQLSVLAAFVCFALVSVAQAQTGTITFQGQIVADDGSGHMQYVTIQQTPGATYPYTVYSKNSGRVLASFTTYEDAVAFVNQANVSTLLS